jgi:putative transferase (TIGR04331 family)
MKEIIIGQIPNDFNPKIHIPIAPFNFIGKENVYLDWEGLNFIKDPFKGKEELHEFNSESLVIVDELIIQLAEYLNNKYSLNYSIKFWQIILSGYAVLLVQSTIERYIRIRDFINKHKKSQLLLLLVKNDKSWYFNDVDDFLNNGILNANFNEWLISRIIETNYLPKWEIKYRDVQLQASAICFTNSKDFPLSIKAKLYNYLNSKLFRCYNIPGVNIFSRSLFEFALRFKKPIILDIKKSDNLIKNKNCLFNFDFLELALLTLPISIRNVSNLCKEVNKQSFTSGKLNLILGSELWYNIDKKIVQIALAKENNEKIIAIQHGGHNYGTAEVCGMIDQIELKQDFFFTWGWGLETPHSTYKNVPSFLLSNKTYSQITLKSKVILVGTRATLYSYRIDSLPQAIQWLDYRKNKVSFIETIISDLNIDLWYRPFSDETGSLKDKDYYHNMFPSINIIEGDLEEHVLKCKLLILDHPGTILNIALAANIPTICFWKDEHFPFNENAQQYFQELKKVGILFSDPYSAAEKVKSIIFNVTGWWNNVDLQNAKNKWVLKYAYTTINWRREWLRQLWKLK